ncbi:MAG TPA: malto-oligosyltrehalose trehalohydrolase [Vicinamibacterales bacterium]|nr:malto-oligosyltrehalose trehalohydrolase [Vicinamibacterales bacterium]
MSVLSATRRLNAGAELRPEGGADVRVWAPACRTLDLVLADTGRTIPMEPEEGGYFRAFDPGARAGGRYWFRLDGDRLRPDPASRYQPEGPHEFSAYVDPRAFTWTDEGRQGARPDGQAIYELHVGTFTREGTWAAAAVQLEELARIGITVIEMMPIAEFPGRFGWGYDGVNLYAPAHIYGTPDDLRAFVDRAHRLGLCVILDVVYNHFGPAGNYLAEFSPDYFTDKYTNDWGRAINFEGPEQVRAYFVENGAYWIDEFHFDGLRLDATQDIKDRTSAEHVIAAVVGAARHAAGARPILVVAENEPQETRIVRPRERGGFGADALWNDDAHHAAAVALTGRREAYYRDYEGTAQELISCARYGYLYQGQWYTWQKKRRGTPALDLMPRHFIAYLENHDQVANSAWGSRLHHLSAPACYRAMTAWLLLGPQTPMLFQGQEFGSSKPFLYFADHEGELGESVRRGRVEFLSQFPSLTDTSLIPALPPPADERTFEACKLDFDERQRHRAAYALHCDLLALRRSDPVLARAGMHRPEGAILSDRAFLLRYLDRDHGDRLLIVNLGCDLDLTPMGEPLLAPPQGRRWRLAWSSEAPRYGGQGTPPLQIDEPGAIPGGSATFFAAEQEGDGPDQAD